MNSLLKEGRISALYWALGHNGEEAESLQEAPKDEVKVGEGFGDKGSELPSSYMAEPGMERRADGEGLLSAGGRGYG